MHCRILSTISGTIHKIAPPAVTIKTSPDVAQSFLGDELQQNHPLLRTTDRVFKVFTIYFLLDLTYSQLSFIACDSVVL